jgi:hypothetical protein
MPAIVPFIPLLISAAATTASTVYSAVNKPSAPKAPDTSQADAAAKLAEDNAKKQAFTQAAPGVQERLGGSVSPDFFADEVARISGNPGDRQMAEQVLSQLLGLGSTPGNIGTTSQTSPISSFANPTGGTQPFGRATGGTGSFPGTEGLGGSSGGFFSQFSGLGEEGGSRGSTGDYI